VSFRLLVLSITASSNTFDVSKEGKNVRLRIRAGDVVISIFPPAFQAPYCKNRLDWIGLDWIGLDLLNEGLDL